MLLRSGGVDIFYIDEFAPTLVSVYVDLPPLLDLICGFGTGRRLSDEPCAGFGRWMGSAR